MTSPSQTLVDNSATTGEINLTWSDAIEDGDWYSYRVYNREVGITEWTLIEEITTDLTNYDIDFYGFAANLSNEAVVVEVTQVTLGDLVEGSYAGSDTYTPSGASGYYLIDQSTPANNFFLEHAIGDSWNDEWETGEFNLINRGRKLDVGTHTGRKGQIEAVLFPTAARPVRTQYLELLQLQQSGNPETFIRTPFGDLIKTSITDIGYNRVAAGSDDHMEVSISWTEVA
jgi:hypothetical protein